MQCTQPNCQNDADHTYSWPWGEEGACCRACKPALETTAAQLSQPIAFRELADAERGTDPPPAAADELAGAQATIIAMNDDMRRLEGKVARLERELEQAMQSNRELSRQNTVIGKQNVQLLEELTKLRGESVVEG